MTLRFGGDSPGEIAISILAEVLQVRHGAARSARAERSAEHPGEPADGAHLRRRAAATDPSETVATRTAATRTDPEPRPEVM